jgi:hypothetical protein
MIDSEFNKTLLIKDENACIHNNPVLIEKYIAECLKLTLNQNLIK